jgi:fibronectin type 3 domain-containing protein
MKWIDSIAPQAPSLKISYDRDNYRVLQWTSKNTAQENLQFAIYKFLPNENVNIQSAKNLVAIVSGNSWTDKNKVDAKYQYVVTALDRLHNESATSNVAE